MVHKKVKQGECNMAYEFMKTLNEIANQKLEEKLGSADVSSGKTASLDTRRKANRYYYLRTRNKDYRKNQD